MTYLRFIQRCRWIRGYSDKYGGSYYGIRIGSEGRHGLEVPEISKQEEEDMIAWFGQHGIRQDAFETNMWWSMEEFHHESQIEKTTDLMICAGYQFRMSKDAYNALFNAE